MDKEWIGLIKLAEKQGLTPNEVREILKKIVKL